MGQKLPSELTPHLTVQHSLDRNSSKRTGHAVDDALYPAVIFPLYAGGILNSAITGYLRAANRRDLLCENEHAARFL
jgi:hypothetical protein